MDKFSWKNKKNKFKKYKSNIAKYFKEDGEAVGFPLFKESDIKIDEFDNKVKIWKRFNWGIFYYSQRKNKLSY